MLEKNSKYYMFEQYKNRVDVGYVPLKWNFPDNLFPMVKLVDYLPHITIARIL